MKIRYLLFALILAMISLPIQTATAEELPEILIVIDDTSHKREGKLPTHKVCGLISNDVTCGIISESHLLDLIDRHSATVMTLSDLELSYVNDNGEVVPANPYISTDTEK